jgi:hypothetical protein
MQVTNSDVNNTTNPILEKFNISFSLNYNFERTKIAADNHDNITAIQK